METLQSYAFVSAWNGSYSYLAMALAQTVYTILVYDHIDTKTKRKTIGKAIGSTSPAEKISQTAYKIEGEEILKNLYGLK